ncbi:unnamed protein product [Ranitomeya imitator]|uniref:Globin domain-containing protein n=1 Tax=Ranitomeya imitator TaxID=111125 RepID=A0ABN9LJK4_9NEOB|nr:unnamed protein product [Ranitomeya imitator]
MSPVDYIRSRPPPRTQNKSLALPSHNMGLSDSEKAAISSLWEKIAPEASKLGAESMSRLFQNHPDAKSFFSRFDLTPGSQDLLTHGGKIFNALGDATKNLDSLSKYQDLHTNKLKVPGGHMKVRGIM